MTKVYELSSDFENFAFFQEQYINVDETFIDKYWEWKNIDLEKYEPVVLKIRPSDNRKKNYDMDISTASKSLIILSEKAIEVLKDILEKYGQIIPVITESKRKKFYGFYPNKNVYDDSIINVEKSDYRQAEKGKIFYKVVLKTNYPKDDYIFVLFDNPMTVFVTEKFKNLVEEHDLKGFNFDEYKEVQVCD